MQKLQGIDIHLIILRIIENEKMSVIEIKTYPTTHIIIRDFLDALSKKKLLDSLLPIRENH